MRKKSLVKGDRPAPGKIYHQKTKIPHKKWLVALPCSSGIVWATARAATQEAELERASVCASAAFVILVFPS